ncbi:MAG: hypothetical protein KDC38_02090 [Planctomycetes bacterium]|nr:hypothetical protein [Planctomycetota bacterium]
MADINLEAEQVVGEEDEGPPPEKKKSLLGSKALIIFGAILVLEAVAVFFILDVVNGGGATADAEGTEEAVDMDLTERYSKPGRIVLDSVSIYDPSDPSPRGDRRFTFDLVLRIEEEAYKELQAAAERNEFAMDLVKDDIKEVVRSYLLRQGGHPFKNRDHQEKLGPRLRDYLNEQLAPLKGKILKVDVDKFQPSKY